MAKKVVKPATISVRTLDWRSEILKNLSIQTVPPIKNDSYCTGEDPPIHNGNKKRQKTKLLPKNKEKPPKRTGHLPLEPIVVRLRRTVETSDRITLLYRQNILFFYVFIIDSAFYKVKGISGRNTIFLNSLLKNPIRLPGALRSFSAALSKKKKIRKKGLTNRDLSANI